MPRFHCPAPLATGAELSQPDFTKAYGGDSSGYTDYPTLDELQAA